MLTVLFKVLRSRTRDLHKGRKRPCCSPSSHDLTRDYLLSRIVACAAGGDENFSLKGARCRNTTRGNSKWNFANYLSVRRRTLERAKTTTEDDERDARCERRCCCMSRINDLANRARKSKATLSIIRAAARVERIFFYLRKSRREKLLIGSYFI